MDVETRLPGVIEVNIEKERGQGEGGGNAVKIHDKLLRRYFY